MDSVHHIWCPLSSQEYQDLPDGAETTLTDKSSDFAGMIEEDNWDAQATDHLVAAMDTLDPRSQDIIRARWLDDDNKATLHELAERYGISAERVRQLENNAMKKLRSAIAL